MTKNFNRIVKQIQESCCKDNSSILTIEPDIKKVTLCAYCDRGGKEKQKWIERGYRISHGICPKCNDEQEKILANL
jgi:hypothetical protein